MTQFFAKAALAALIGFGGLAVTATTASADDLQFGFNEGGISVQFRDRDGGYDRGGRERGHGWGRPGRGGRCDPWLAEEKARDRFGMRRARVVDVTPRRVVVEGRQRGRFVTIAFANDRGCPTLGRY